MAEGSYTSTDTTIKLDEPTLLRLQAEYESLAAEFKKRVAGYPWSTRLDLTLQDAWPMALGSSSFAEAQELAKSVEKVRANLMERFELTYADADGLATGIKSLLADTDAVEELNSMTATDFGSFIQESGSPLTPES